MSLKKTSNRKIDKEENDIFKSWCHDFEPDDQSAQCKDSGTLVRNFDLKQEDPVFGTLIPVKDGKANVHKAEADGYNEIDMAISKAEPVNPIDRPRMIFNIARIMKSHSSQDSLEKFLNRSLDLDYITKSQKAEIIKILG